MLGSFPQPNDDPTLKQVAALPWWNLTPNPPSDRRDDRHFCLASLNKVHPPLYWAFQYLNCHLGAPGRCPGRSPTVPLPVQTCQPMHLSLRTPPWNANPRQKLS